MTRSFAPFLSIVGRTKLRTENKLMILSWLSFFGQGRRKDKNTVSSRTVVNWNVILVLCSLLTFIWPLLSFAEESVPDWTLWKCTKPTISFNVIETYECHLPLDEQSTSIQLKVSGRTVPFLIGWNFVNQAENPIANAYTALYKDGRWIVGARGTGFTTENSASSIIFYIFLAPNFAVREQLEIKIADGDEH